MKWNQTTIVLSICFVVLCVAGTVVLWRGVQSAIILQQAKSWPTVQGTITSCKFENRANQKGDVKGKAIIKYKYQVKGKPYKNDKLSFDTNGVHSRDAQKAIFEKLKAVKQIKVYYNPDDPRQSALSCETSGDMYFSLIIGTVCLSIALGLGLLALPGTKADQALLKNLKTYE